MREAGARRAAQARAEDHGDQRQRPERARRLVAVQREAGEREGDRREADAFGVAVQRDVKTGGNTPAGIRIDEGLKGGEELIVNPPKDLKQGAKVAVREAKQS